jgi:hypothetical protein
MLLLIGRRSAAGRRLGLRRHRRGGFVAMPGSAATYWDPHLLEASRIGPPALAYNQAVFGALTRLLDGAPPTLAVARRHRPALAGRPRSSPPAGGARRRSGCPLPAPPACRRVSRCSIASPLSSGPQHTGSWGRARRPGALGAASRPRGRLDRLVFVARPVVWPAARSGPRVRMGTLGARSSATILPARRPGPRRSGRAGRLVQPTTNEAGAIRRRRHGTFDRVRRSGRKGLASRGGEDR